MNGEGFPPFAPPPEPLENKVFLFMLAVVLITLALTGCTSVTPILRTARCGAWQGPRPTDRAVCRECVDETGAYAQCRGGIQR